MIWPSVDQWEGEKLAESQPIEERGGNGGGYEGGGDNGKYLEKPGGLMNSFGGGVILFNSSLCGPPEKTLPPPLPNPLNKTTVVWGGYTVYNVHNSYCGCKYSIHNI